MVPEPGAGAPTSRLRVLLVEDAEDDEVLLLRFLRHAGYDVESRRVETAIALRAALRENWDLILSDYHLPGFTAPEAFAIVKERGLDIPFIIVSGAVGEDAAVRAMKAGVHDYIGKGNLARLLPAVEREMREARVRADQRRLREQLLISDRMASAGALAAGVAHEINNPLAVAAANLEFVYAVLERIRVAAADSPAHADRRDVLDELLSEIDPPFRDAQEAVARIRDIVRDIKTFSRPHDDTPEAVDVRQVLESALRMSWNEIRHRAKVVRELADVPPVAANASRLGQVLLNLIVNAAHAIPEGRAEEHEIRVVTRMVGNDRIAIEVRDTGVGISPENLGRIFDPFFTTKPVGVGTGLGLSICHRIVTDLGGDISVDSTVGKGTTFRVVLPAAHARASAPLRKSVVPDSGPRGHVLVVDDEAPIGRALKRILTRYHDVTLVTSARDALIRIRRGERFDAILSDLMMPDVSGMDFYERLLEMAPDQASRVVFMTGGAFTTRARAFVGKLPNAQIEKPFETASVLAAVAEVLERSGALKEIGQTIP